MVSLGCPAPCRRTRPAPGRRVRAVVAARPAAPRRRPGRDAARRHPLPVTCVVGPYKVGPPDTPRPHFLARLNRRPPAPRPKTISRGEDGVMGEKCAFQIDWQSVDGYGLRVGSASPQPVATPRCRRRSPRSVGPSDQQRLRARCRPRGNRRTRRLREPNTATSPRLNAGCGQIVLGDPVELGVQPGGGPAGGQQLLRRSVAGAADDIDRPAEPCGQGVQNPIGEVADVDVLQGSSLPSSG